MTTAEYKLISDQIPKQPGIYRFIDKDDIIIYVGKAKSLRNRVASYFGEKKDQAYKTRVMVKNAVRLEFTVVDSESDALLLENTFIKKFQPRYNVMLKDAKSYAYLCIKNERFPRVFFTRKVFRDGSKYFGPYTSKSKIKQIFEIIKQLFPLRTCQLNLSRRFIDKGKYKVCLEYHLKNCMGPCQNLETEENYNNKIEQVKNILNGHFKPVKDYINQAMSEYAERLEYEKAAMMKERLTYLEDYQAKSTVVSSTVNDVDVFTVSILDDWAYVNYLKVLNGVLINTDTLEVKMNLDSDEDDILSYVIPSVREKFNSIAPEIVLQKHMKISLPDSKVIVPQRGDKKKLLELSEKNLNYFILHKRREAANKLNKVSPTERILKTLQQDLRMEEVPFHIECFDNSNIQGTNPVASCVVFKNAKPSKKDYRKFNIKTVEGPNDFASMEEVVYRRYKRLKEEGEALPQLVIIDGGKGQLGAAMKIINDLDLTDKMTVIGIAKRLEEIFFPGDPIPIYINKKSESLKLIQQLRNEAHRFAISFHRDQRSRNFMTTSLESIPGVGKKTIDTLLSHFKSTKRISKASIEELAVEVGHHKAHIIHQYFQEKEE